MSVKKSKNARSSERYSAKLLFQLRFGNEVGSAPMRITEHRIITLMAVDPEDAYRQAIAYGKANKTSFRNDDGVKVSLELVGVMDLMHLGAEADAIEVWYEMKKMRAPMERRAALIPSKNDLPVFRLGRGSHETAKKSAGR